MKNNRNDTRFLSLNYEDEGCGGGLGSRFLFSQISRTFYSIAKNTLFVLFCSERKLGKPLNYVPRLELIYLYYKVKVEIKVSSSCCYFQR